MRRGTSNTAADTAGEKRLGGRKRNQRRAEEKHVGEDKGKDAERKLEGDREKSKKQETNRGG